MSKEQLKGVENRTNDELLCTAMYYEKDLGVALIVAYHPGLNGLNKLIRKILNIQGQQIIKSLFTPVTFESFPTGRKHRTQLA